MSQVLSAALILVGLVLIYLRFRIPRGMPPGPFLPLPVLRVLPFSRYYRLTAIEAFDELRRRHGDIFSVHLGHKRVVIMCDFDQVQIIFHIHRFLTGICIV